MNTLSSQEVASPVDVGLTGSSLRHPNHMKLLLCYATQTQPRCRVLTKLSELGHDIIGPTPLGPRVCELIAKEHPDLVNIRIDENNPAAFHWIPKIWSDYRTPVLVVTMCDDPAVYNESVKAGAFVVMREDASTEAVQSLFSASVLRGAALRESQERIEQLERNLANRRLVEQAKWVLVQRSGMSEPEAHLALQNMARNTRTPLATIAKSIIEKDGLPLSPPPHQTE